MKPVTYIRLCLPLAALILSSCATVEKAQPTAATTPEPGLRDIRNPAFDELRVRNDLELAAFTTLYVSEPTVEFEDDWRQKQNRGTAGRMTDRDAERIERLLATETRKILEQNISQGLNLPLIREPDEQTLYLMPAITDLVVNSPFNSRGYSMTVLAQEAGQMTLTVRLQDGAETTLLEFTDTRSTRRFDDYRRSEKVQNLHESRRLLNQWSASLLDVLQPKQELASTANH